MSWKIRFYSGLNQAVDVPLDEGRVLIGTDPLLADLVLVDAGLAGVHLVLEVDAKGVRLLDWAAEQIGLARIALARARWTGETPRAVGLMLAEAAQTAREHGAAGLAERAERLTPRPQTV